MTQITVVKRSGHKEPLQIDKWQAQVAKVCQGIADVSQSMIEIKSQLINVLHIKSSGKFVHCKDVLVS